MSRAPCRCMLILRGDPSAATSAAIPEDRRLPGPTSTRNVLRGVAQTIAIVVAASMMFLLAGALIVIDIAATLLWLPAMLTLQGWIAGYLLSMVAAYGAMVVVERCRVLASHGQPV